MINGQLADTSTIAGEVSKPTTQEVVIDDTLSIEGAAADAKATGDALQGKASTSSVSGLQEQINTLQAALSNMNILVWG